MRPAASRDSLFLRSAPLHVSILQKSFAVVCVRPFGAHKLEYVWYPFAGVCAAHWGNHLLGSLIMSLAIQMPMPRMQCCEAAAWIFDAAQEFQVYAG